MKEKKYLEKILEMGAFVMFTALVINVTYQILTRNIFTAYSVVWTEEISRFLFIYSIVFAAPLAMKHREYVSVDLLLGMLSKRPQQVLNIIIDVVSAILFILVAIKGIEFIRTGIGQSSATIGMSMVFMHASMSITSSLIAIYGIINVLDDIRKLKRGGVTL